MRKKSPKKSQKVQKLQHKKPAKSRLKLAQLGRLSDFWAFFCQTFLRMGKKS
jgi:hypothetical protein